MTIVVGALEGRSGRRDKAFSMVSCGGGGDGGGGGRRRKPEDVVDRRGRGGSSADRSG